MELMKMTNLIFILFFEIIKNIEKNNNVNITYQYEAHNIALICLELGREAFIGYCNQQEAISFTLLCNLSYSIQ